MPPELTDCGMKRTLLRLYGNDSPKKSAERMSHKQIADTKQRDRFMRPLPVKVCHWYELLVVAYTESG
jgi:hypothetical protein